MIEDRQPPVVGTCHCCQEPVRAGEERQVGMEHATSACADILLHRRLCRPVNYRTPHRTPA